MQGSIDSRFQTHPAAWADVAEIVRLRNAGSQDTRGADVTAEHWQRRHYYDNGINLETDTQLAFDGERCVAYVELASEAPYVIHEMLGVVDPQYRGRGLGSALIQWVENRARAMLPQAPEDTAVFVHCRLFGANLSASSAGQ